MSLDAAEHLTEALLVGIQRLGRLSDHASVQSRAARRVELRALVDDVQMATDLYGPILLSAKLSQLSVGVRPDLEALVSTVEAREEALMREERLGAADEDRAYAVDSRATHARQEISGYLKTFTQELTRYRQDERPVQPPRLRWIFGNSARRDGDRGSPW